MAAAPPPLARAVENHPEADQVPRRRGAGRPGGAHGPALVRRGARRRGGGGESLGSEILSGNGNLASVSFLTVFVEYKYVERLLQEVILLRNKIDEDGWLQSSGSSRAPAPEERQALLPTKASERPSRALGAGNGRSLRSERSSHEVLAVLFLVLVLRVSPAFSFCNAGS